MILGRAVPQRLYAAQHSCRSTSDSAVDLKGLFGFVPYRTDAAFVYPHHGDEVNIIEPGENYGWPMATEGVNYPGTSISPHQKLEGVQAPVNHWTPSIAPSGIVIYDGNAFPEFNGDLLVSSLAGQGVFRLDFEDGRIVNEQRLFHELGKRIRDIDIGEDGDLYLLTDHNPGQLLRIDAAVAYPAGQ